MYVELCDYIIAANVAFGGKEWTIEMSHLYPFSAYLFHELQTHQSHGQTALIR